MTTMSPSDEARRQLLIQALFGAVLGAALLKNEAAAADAFGGRPSKLPPGQSIYRISGKVLVNGSACDASTRIAANDTIETAPGSELVFVVGDSAMLLREGSRVTLEGGAGTAALAGVKVLTGKLLSVFPTGQAKRITTATASISIVGTGVYLEADPEQTYFCTCYGVSEVAALKDPQSRETVAASHHDRPLYIVAGGQAGRNIRNAPFINHTDQELMMIEALVGRTPPFNFPGSQYNTPRSRGAYGK